VERLEGRDVPSAFQLTPLVPVSGPSPFLGNPVEANDPPSAVNAETEPYVAADPANPDHLVGAWIQDAARGIVAAVSFNGGNSWQSVTIPGLSPFSGGQYPHYSDPWVSFARNGDVYLSSLGNNFDEGEPNAVLVSKSADGGLTWGAPTAVKTDSVALNDKDSVTADPTNSQFAYATWDRVGSHSNTNPAMFARTTDGGQTWEPARVLFDPGTHNEAFDNQIVVLPDGTLVDFFVNELYRNSAHSVNHFDRELSLVRSTDKGQTWQPVPTPVADMIGPGDTYTMPGLLGVPNPDGGTGITAGNDNFDVAVDPHNGNLYAVWQDTRFSNSGSIGTAFSMSADGGLTWSAPIRVNQTPGDIPTGNQMAFLPSVAVNQDGVVALTYYDFRNNTSAPGVPTDLWMAHADPTDGLTNPASWANENRMTPASFDIETAPVREGGYFIGDYEGLVAEGKHFGAFFSMPSGTDPCGIFFRDPLPTAATETAVPPIATVAEGNAVTPVTDFIVPLSPAGTQTVTVAHATAGIDDQAASGTLTSTPGGTSNLVNGDSMNEADGTFYLDPFGNSGNSLFTKNRDSGGSLGS
jgi:hypothetical protein